jgi:DNA-binding NarL/FixJ family response regulator
MANGVSFALDTGVFRPTGHEVAGALAALGKQRREGLSADLHVAPSNRAALTRATVEAQRALQEAAFAAATAALRARSLAAVLDETLAMLADAETRPAATAKPAVAVAATATALSAREREVLVLVAEGRTNKAIAEALFVSPNTVKTHVASLLRKHDVGSRAQLAALVGAQAARSVHRPLT